MSEELHKLGEVLREAREAKGVDLARVERETKIRERYLSALERGEYRELPGSVYTKGFLRNYGTYLGLDPEYLIDLYRIETASPVAERPRMPVPPRPLAPRRARAFVLTPSVIVAALLTVMVGALIAWIGYEFVTFARTPELRIVDPAGNLSSYPEQSITIRGTTAPNATVTVRNLPENPTVRADENGIFEMTVELLHGSNLIELVAHDPVTNRDSAVETRTIIVAGPSPGPSAGAVALQVDEPAADATVTSPVAIRGTGAPRSSVGLSATFVEGPGLPFTITDAAGQAVEPDLDEPSAPEAITVEVDASGAFEGELSLPAGTWDLTMAPSEGEPIVRRVVVGPGEGLAGRLTIAEGESYVEIEQDGEPIAGVSGTIAGDGDRIDLGADETLRIRVGNAGAVRLMLNGISIGAMGSDGQVVEWRISRTEG